MTNPITQKLWNITFSEQPWSPTSIVDRNFTVYYAPCLLALMENACFLLYLTLLFTLQSYLQQIRQLARDSSLSLGCLVFTITVMKLLLTVSDDVRECWTNQETEDNIINCVFDIIPLCKFFKTQTHNSQTVYCLALKSRNLISGTEFFTTYYIYFGFEIRSLFKFFTFEYDSAF